MLENVLFKGLKKPKEKKIKKIQQSYKIEGEDLNLLNSFKDLQVKTIFESPKLVQQIVIPYILKDKNICVQSFTGSGKTLSYLLPLVELSFKKNIKAIVLVPNDQLKEQVKRVLKYEIVSENKAEIIILRPDEILNSYDDKGNDLLDSNKGNDLQGSDNPKLNTNTPLHSFDNITHLIIDEADLMIHKDSLNLFKSLSSILNSCTVSVFSATLNREVEKS
ncbi:ATP-dependent RNA helicase dbp9 [Nosema bombycis CQ1]|uniref:ATP-dependent RNA helicase n=1 Tax=Nosema bombycis (strain CQ1 / CVCC 102059) TaxID=578461 RepID=R0KQU0_NOSB1|nr:ATP-dependent RNA helicase dbp9 [Nosema bombycis CQ1]|eukprot:EOB13106.1 ATP-dependent RNA helicase dbp9 [Nosema bombycis CQ1]